jgi:hypothetical protein
MQLYTINTGYFKLDGGAMFGVVPKSMWNKINPADENNMCSWALRCLLIQEGNRLILIDNGMGDKQDEKFFGHYYLHGNDTLDKSLEVHGLTCILIIVGVVLFGKEINWYRHLKMQPTGVMNVIGNGLPTPTTVKKLLS